MSAVPDESPADEYDRQQVERRSTVARRVAKLAWWSLGLHAGAFGLICVGCGAGAGIATLAEEAGRAPTPDVVMLGTFVGACGILLVWAASFVVAGVASVATVRQWSLLSPIRRAFGLLPWGLFLAEFTMAFGIGLFG